MDAEDLSDWPPGVSEMAGRIRAHDWASTPLGPIEDWSDRLRVMVEQVLASPMVSSLVCGIERLLIYNDAAARLFGSRHPKALGRPLPENFPEGWVTVASYYERAFAGESVIVSGQPLDTRGDSDPVLDVFDAYLTPVREGPAVAYVHMAGFEIGNSARATARLRESEERHAFLLDLSDALRPLVDPADIAEIASHRLGERLGASRVCYAQIEGEHLHIRREYVRSVPSVIGDYSTTMFGRGFLFAYRPGELVTSADVVSDHRFDASGRAELLSRSIAAFADMVLTDHERGASLLAVQNATPRNWTEAEMHLIREVGQRVGAATARARTEIALRDSEERFAQFAASSSDALWIRDAATLVMEYASPAIQKIYGIEPDAILGDVERWAALILPEDHDTARRHLEQSRSGEAITHEFRIRHPADGEVRWIKNTDFPLRDADGRVQRIGGIAEDVTEARRSAKRQEVLVNELQHRARNLLGVVSAMADRTLKQGGPVEAFEDRLKALSRAQGLLSQGGSDTVEIGDLVRAELAAHTGGGRERVTIAGPTVHLTSRQVQNFALALHELTTNAVKYGALRDGSGRLTVTWKIVLDQRERRRLALNWVESGVTVHQDVARRRGYGTELIQEALAYALRAEIDYVLGEDGVRCRIEMPVS